MAAMGEAHCEFRVLWKGETDTPGEAFLVKPGSLVDLSRAEPYPMHEAPLDQQCSVVCTNDPSGASLRMPRRQVGRRMEMPEALNHAL